MSSTANDCGNRHIDGLATKGRRIAVWSQLEHRFPRVKAHSEKVWIARRDGRMRWIIERDARFAAIRDPDGPRNDAEWDLLSVAALEAAGVNDGTSTESETR